MCYTTPHMIKRVLHLLLCIACAQVVFSQTKQPFPIELSVGAMHSVGREKIRMLESTTQPITVIYPNPSTYEKPLLQLRAGYHYAVLKNLSLLGATGLTVRFRENYFGDFKTRASVPLQAGVGVNIVRGKKIDLEAASLGGLQLFYVDVSPFRIKPGGVYNFELAVKLKNKITGLLLFKAGYERQQEKVVFDHPVRSGSSLEPEQFRYNINRNLGYLSIGIRL